MLKFIVIGIALFAVYKLFMGDKKKREMDNTEKLKQRVAAGDMLKDPVCGAYVAKDGSIRVKEGDTIHLFCSYECRDKYIKQLEATTVNND